MPDVTFRKMKDKDLVEVVEIEKETFTDPWSYDAFNGDLANDLSWPLTALVNNVVVGYCALYIVAGELQIGNFAVAPKFKRQGIGRKMMDEVIRVAREHECAYIYLEVRESNLAAIALYVSFGFVNVGRRVGYYRNPRESAILMAKEL